MNTKSYYPKAGDVQEKWYLVDAEGHTVGRLASQIASLLRGKQSPTYTPGVDPKVYLVVVNAEKVVFTGRKNEQKIYYRHSLWKGGLKETKARHMFDKKPTEVLRLAVHGMLPKNSLGRALETHLRLFAGSEHAHAAQQPEKIELTPLREAAIA
jgi:large subunit ribosomal protein L13